MKQCSYGDFMICVINMTDFETCMHFVHIDMKTVVKLMDDYFTKNSMNLKIDIETDLSDL